MRSQRFNDGEITFEAMVSDDGPDTIAFVHGFPDTMQTWGPVFERLKSERRLVAIPLPGWSQTPGSFAETIPNLVESVRDRLRALDADRLTYVGHDWGAVLGWSLAAHHSDLVDSAILISVPPLLEFVRHGLRSPRQLWRSRYIAGFQLPRFPEARLRDGDYIEQLWRRWSPHGPPSDHLEHVKRKLATHPAGSLAYYRGLRGLLFDSDLRRYLAARPISPSIGVYGLKDRCVSTELWSDTHEWVGSNTAIVELDAGHWPQWEAPDALAGIIDEFA